MNPQVLASSNNFGVTFIASLLIWLMFFLVFLWSYWGKVKRNHVLHALLSSFLALTLTQAIKLFFPTLRPFEINGEPPLTLTIPGDGAFPSSHAAAAFGLASSIVIHDRKMGILFLVLALVVSLGRVLGNVHYYTDVLVGALVGMSVAIFLKRFRLFKKPKN